VTPMDEIRAGIDRFGTEAAGHASGVRAAARRVAEAATLLQAVAGKSDQSNLVAARTHLSSVPPTLDAATAQLKAAAEGVRAYRDRIF
jgi:hypothetical protein